MASETHEKRGYLLEDFRLFHLADTLGTRVDYHYHEFHKLLLVVSGTGVYVVEGKRYALRPGDLVLVGSHSLHKPEFEPGISYERIILYLSPAFLENASCESWNLETCFSGDRGHVLRLGEQSRFVSRLAELEGELFRKQPGWEIAARGLVLRLCVELGRMLSGEDVTLPEPLQPRDRRVREMLAYLDSHLEEDISVENLAQQFYISKYHMMRLFRQETGTTVHGYLTQRRLLLARDRIQQGMSTTEACFHSGFGSYSAFSRAYGKFFGITPTGRKGSLPEQEESFE